MKHTTANFFLAWHFILCHSVFAAIGFSGYNAHSQSAFENLDFEIANLPVVPAGEFGTEAAVAQAIPGWNAFLGVEVQSTVLHNNFTLGAPGISIFGPHWGTQPQGDYSLWLTASVPFPTLNPAVAQTAQLPAGAQSIRFFAYFTSLEVTLSGELIPLVTLSSGPNQYTIYGGDISRFAGQVNELRFTCPQIDPVFRDSALIDGISFSAQPIPEPSSLALFVMGGLALAFVRCRFARRR